MKLTLESTTKIITMEMPGGATVDARIWEGQTDSGIPCHAYIARVAVANDEDTSQFDRELQEQAPPSEAVDWLPSRLAF